MTTVKSLTSHSTFVRHSPKVPNGVIKLQLGNELLEAVQTLELHAHSSFATATTR